MWRMSRRNDTDRMPGEIEAKRRRQPPGYYPLLMRGEATRGTRRKNNGNGRQPTVNIVVHREDRQQKSGGSRKGAARNMTACGGRENVEKGLSNQRPSARRTVFGENRKVKSKISACVDDVHKTNEADIGHSASSSHRYFSAADGLQPEIVTVVCADDHLMSTPALLDHLQHKDLLPQPNSVFLNQERGQITISGTLESVKHVLDSLLLSKEKSQCQQVAGTSSDNEGHTTCLSGGTIASHLLPPCEVSTPQLVEPGNVAEDETVHIEGSDGVKLAASVEVPSSLWSAKNWTSSPATVEHPPIPHQHFTKSMTQTVDLHAEGVGFCTSKEEKGLTSANLTSSHAQLLPVDEVLSADHCNILRTGVQGRSVSIAFGNSSQTSVPGESVSFDFCNTFKSASHDRIVLVGDYSCSHASTTDESFSADNCNILQTSAKISGIYPVTDCHQEAVTEKDHSTLFLGDSFTKLPAPNELCARSSLESQAPTKTQSQNKRASSGEGEKTEGSNLCQGRRANHESTEMIEGNNSCRTVPAFLSELLPSGDGVRCGVCHRSVDADPGCITRHMEERHGSREAAHPCNMCSLVFPDKRVLLSHLKQVHEAADLTCQVCGKKFQCQRYLRTHLQRHAGVRKYECPQCGWRFFERHKLKFHLESHKAESERQLPYSCDWCGKQFANRASWSDHCNTHSGKRPFQCLKCGVSFAHRIALRRHKWTHEKVKPYSCSFCSRSFSFKPKLTEHMVTHTGVSNHVCSHCDKVFTAASSLKRHEAKCQASTPEDSAPQAGQETGADSTFLCSVCNQCFPTHPQAKEHICTHHLPEQNSDGELGLPYVAGQVSDSSASGDFSQASFASEKDHLDHTHGEIQGKSVQNCAEVWIVNGEGADTQYIVIEQGDSSSREKEETLLDKGDSYAAKSAREMIMSLEERNQIQVAAITLADLSAG